MRVHRLGCVNVLVRQTLITDIAPIDTQGLDITALAMILQPRLDLALQPPGQIQRAYVARRAIMFGKGIDAKSLSVGLLLAVDDIAFDIEQPIEAAVLAIHEMCPNIVGSALRQGACIHVINMRRHGRKEPQHPRIDDDAFRRVRHDLTRRVDLAMETTIDRVDHVRLPPTQDIGGFGARFVTQAMDDFAVGHQPAPSPASQASLRAIRSMRC